MREPDRRQYYPEIEALRGVAILGVLAWHILGQFTAVDDPTGIFRVTFVLWNLVRWAVPLFVFISGFVLYASYGKDFSASVFYRRRLARIIPPYIAFSLFYLGYYAIRDGWPGGARIAGALFLGQAAAHMWFFRLIIELYLLFPLAVSLYRKLPKGKGRIFCLLLTAAFQLCCTHFARIIALESGSQTLRLTVHLFTWGSYIFYFYLGMWCCENRAQFLASFEKKPWLLPALVCAITVLAGADNTSILEGMRRYGGYSRISEQFYFPIHAIEAFLYTLSICALYGGAAGLVRLPQLASLGRYSFGIYLVHPVFVSLFTALSHRAGFGIDSGISYLFIFAGTLALSLAAVRIMNATPVSGILIGLPPAGFGKKSDIKCERTYAAN